MTWQIIHNGWEGCTHLSDTRIDARYAYEELHGARYVQSNDLGEVCFELPDERTVWLVSTDLETVWPYNDETLRTDDASQRDYSWGQMADLTHEAQVKAFGWCPCQDDQPTYDDCPRIVRVRVS